MDLNHAYATHQQAFMRAGAATDADLRQSHLTEALAIAARIGSFQRKLGAAAACAWSKAQVETSG
jgi:hypothetical protein